MSIGGDQSADVRCPACGEPVSNTTLAHHLEADCERWNVEAFDRRAGQ